MLRNEGLFLSWRKLRIAAMVLLIVAYFFGLLYAKYMRYDVYMSEPEFNWIPFHSPNTSQVISSYILNGLIFLPLGALVALRNKHRAVSLLAAFILCFVLELLQPIFKSGIFDITTVLLSVAGVIVGFLAFQASNRLFPSLKPIFSTTK